MELEEMKTLWGEMSAEIDKQKKLTDSLIIKMTRLNYRNKISKILVPELLGSLVCVGFFIYIMINIQKLNTWYLMAFGLTGAFILLILPVLSIRAIYTMKSVKISADNYKQSLFKYSKGKLQFVFVQKLSFYLGGILLVVILPVMGMLMKGKNLFHETKLWVWYLVAAPLFYIISRWVYKSYMKMTADAENILKELEN